MVEPRLVIHGGAGELTPNQLTKEQEKAYRHGLRASLEAGYQVLKEKDDALLAAVAAVVSLENNEVFNAGKGAVFTNAGTNELEASVMASGQYDKKAAAVSLVKHVKNPIKLAAELLKYEQDTHVLLAGEAVEKMAEEFGLEMVDQSYFFTQKRWDEHRRGLKKGAANTIDDEDKEEGYAPKGTVGAVAMDSKGVIVAATSTGGLTNKIPGRIGDTPQAGAGFWAEEIGHRKPLIVRILSGKTEERASVGLSGTGNGDGFIRSNLCHSIVSLVKHKRYSLQRAAEQVIADTPTEAGVIGIDGFTGDAVFSMNCSMNRGYIDNGGAKVALYEGEVPS
uniref:ARAD1C26092p n=1 Tax=Blastobotrys adeninivorans TaxID=409370 RepID=A0A060T245_BLAAD